MHDAGVDRYTNDWPGQEDRGANPLRGADYCVSKRGHRAHPVVLPLSGIGLGLKVPPHCVLLI